MTESQQQQSASESVLSKVRGLINKAADLEEKNGPQDEEAKACRQKADAMMFKYRIDSAMLDQDKAPMERALPQKRIVTLVGHDNPIADQFSNLAREVCRHAGCQAVRCLSYVRNGEVPELMYTMDVYGYADDLEYFEILFTTLFLHMNGVFFPKPDASKDLAANLIRLRELGMNWLQMAQVYGWSKKMTCNYATGKMVPIKRDGKEIWVHKETGREKTNYALGGGFKRDYHAAAKAAGIPIVIIKSTDSRKQDEKGFRESAAAGYVSHIAFRLREIRNARIGNGLVLKSRMDAVEDMLNKEHPNTMPMESRKLSYNERAVAHGWQHASSADINGSGRVGSPGAAGAITSNF